MLFLQLVNVLIVGPILLVGRDCLFLMLPVRVHLCPSQRLDSLKVHELCPPVRSLDLRLASPSPLPSSLFPLPASRPPSANSDSSHQPKKGSVSRNGVDLCADVQNPTKN